MLGLLLPTPRYLDGLVVGLTTFLESHTNKQQLLALEGKLAEARPFLEKALAVDRRNQQLLFLYARLLLDLGEKPVKVKEVVDDLRRYFPRSRQKVEEYFAEASKGKMRFDADDVY